MLFKYYPYLYWPLFLKRGGLWLFCSIKIRSTGSGVFEMLSHRLVPRSWLLGVLFDISLGFLLLPCLGDHLPFFDAGSGKEDTLITFLFVSIFS